MNGRLREMTAHDIGSVLEIERACFPDPWTEGLFREELDAERRAWVVAEQDGAVVAYGGLAVFDDVMHVMNLAVSPSVRRRGLGREILHELERRGRALGATAVTLEVRRSNAEAIGLYESSGYSGVGVRPGYYADRESALIMWGRLDAEVGEGRTADEADTGQRGEQVWAHGEGAPLILAIETSCDETAAAVIRGEREVLSSVVASQIDVHSRFGGVVPEIASRKHTEAIVEVVAEAMERAGVALGSAVPLPFERLDAIAVTYGPGLVGALVVGLAYAKGLSLATGIPLVGVNHLEGHIFANVLADAEVKPPLVALVVSGGHTSLVHMPEWGMYETMGETLDDATGEAFDKVAKLLGLGYPGGPVISRLAEQGDPTAIDFPRAMMRSGDFSFSLSGLKTAVITYVRHEEAAGRSVNVPNVAASFQQAVIDVQVAKAVRAVKQTGARVFCLAGGVAANAALREALTAAIEPLGVRVSVPPFDLCTDNAAMIAAAAHYRFIRGERLGIAAEAAPGLRLDGAGAPTP